MFVYEFSHSPSDVTTVNTGNTMTDTQAPATATHTVMTDSASSTATLTDRIRAACADLHTQIERLPYPVELLAGRVSRERYRNVLGQLYHVHAALEFQIAGHPVLSDWTGPDYRRAEVILRDVRVLGLLGTHAESGEPPFSVDASLRLTVPANRAAQALIENFARFGSEPPNAPWPLLGALYIFEGSRMGSMVLAGPLAKALGVPMGPGTGLDYHLDGAETRPRAWRAFKARLDGLPVPPGVREAVLTASVETMRGVYRLYETFSA